MYNGREELAKDLQRKYTMFSGSDSTESQNYTQWALNPSAYQNVSNDQVDWAALAQQWIIMKEAGPPPVQQITAPPVVSTPTKPKKEAQNEGGEAPMDVENDKDEDVAPPWTNINVPPPGDSWTWNAQQQQWGWNNTWTGPPGVPPRGPTKPPLLPTPSSYNQFPASSDAASESTNYSGYNNTSSGDYNSGYWNANSNSRAKPHNKRFSKVNPPRPPVVPEPVALDAAKRKQLPAWIREGLEKMERDKQKQLEKEREKQESQVQSEKVKLSEKDAMDIIKSTVKEQKSKYESDNESEDEDGDTSSSELRGKTLTPEPAPLTQEELMVKVRRTMTEILLNVTNKEIYQICKEELQRYINKNKASDDRLSAPSGTNFSAKLGLGMYGGDSGSSSEDSEDEANQDSKDSDTELRETIKRKKAEFSRIEREIEEKLAEAEKAGDDQSRGASPETNDNDSQVDAKNQDRRPVFNSSSERTPPMKNAPQEAKRRSRKSSSYSDESSSDRERSKSKRNHRKSSSSESSTDRHKSYRRSRHSVERKKTSKGTARRSRSSSRRRSQSGARRDSYHSQYSRRSRSRSRSKRSSSKSRHKSARSKRTRSRSRSRHRRSESRSSHRRRSRSRRRSSSSSRKSYHRRRSRSSSSGRGKRSHRH